MAITSLSRYATEAAASFPSRMAVFPVMSLPPTPESLILSTGRGSELQWSGSPGEVISVTAGLSEMPINGACVQEHRHPERRQHHGSTSDEHAHIAQQHPGNHRFLKGFKERSAVCSRSGPPIRGEDYCGARAQPGTAPQCAFRSAARQTPIRLSWKRRENSRNFLLATLWE